MKLIIPAIIIMLFFNSCAGLKNPERPDPPETQTGTGDPFLARYHIVADGTEIFIAEYRPCNDFSATVFMLSGITGINHLREQDVIRLLAGSDRRVVVIHPRGTGYSGGNRGDLQDFNLFISDHLEIIKREIVKYPNKANFLFGHSMSTALAVRIAEEMDIVDGVVLVNPPYILKTSEGMSPGFSDYIRYAFYFIFAPHTPIVDMSGDPAQIKNPEERSEAMQRKGDPIIVKYFSLYVMMQSNKMMQRMEKSAARVNSPLLMIYGTADSLVEREGCDIILDKWKNPDKSFIGIPGGSHGRDTVLEAGDAISEWFREHINGFEDN